MKTAHWFGLLALSPLLLVAGCGGERATSPKGSADKEYEIRGKVTAVASDSKAVTLDHEEIPGLMKAMKMEYRVESPKVLEGIGPGDQVKGRLQVKGDEHVITRLEKAPAGAADSPSPKEVKIKANLAKLSPEDRALAEAQKFCVVETENRLGSMGVPAKVLVKGQPVFLCCKECEEEALADPDRTLARLKELKAKAAPPQQ